MMSMLSVEAEITDRMSSMPRRLSWQTLDERSRCFLVKQGHASTVCQLNLRGMDDELAVISASTDNIEIMHNVLARRAAELEIAVDQLTPEQWLQDFYDNRKGSGKSARPSRAGREHAAVG